MTKLTLLLIIVLLNSCDRKVSDRYLYPPLSRLEINSKRSRLNFYAEFIKKMRQKKIIMFADNYHGHQFFYNVLVTSLQKWLDAIEKGDIKIARKLLLALEWEDSWIKKFIFQYFKGDKNSLLFENLQWSGIRFHAGFSTDFILFLDKLKGIQKRIIFLNADLPIMKRISLRIVGIEPKIDLISRQFNLNYLRRDAVMHKKQFLWFAKTRDRMISSNLIGKLDAHKGYTALVFYGGIHTRRGSIDKTFFSRIEYRSKPVYAYSLVHFLDKRYGRENVTVFSFLRSILDGMVTLSGGKTKPDYFIRLNIQPEHPFPVRFLKPKKILERILGIARGEFRRNDTDSILIGKAWLQQLIEDLFCSYNQNNPTLSGKLKNLNDNLSVMDINHIRARVLPFLNVLVRRFDAVENILQLSSWNKISDYTLSVRHNYHLRLVLRNITDRVTDYEFLHKPYHQGPLPKVHLSKLELAILLRHKKKLQVYSLIQLLTVADDKERRDAFKALHKITGESMSGVGEWKKWWRINRHRYIRTVQ